MDHCCSGAIPLHSVWRWVHLISHSIRAAVPRHPLCAFDGLIPTEHQATSSYRKYPIRVSVSSMARRSARSAGWPRPRTPRFSRRLPSQCTPAPEPVDTIEHFHEARFERSTG